MRQDLDEVRHLGSLCECCRRGDVAELRKRLSRAGTQSTRDRVNESVSGFTPLLYACRGGHLDVCRELIAHGADVNACTKAGASTCLHRAALSGRADVVDLLLTHGASPTARDADGNTALHKASSPAAFDRVHAAHPDLLQVRNNRGDPPVRPLLSEA